MFHYTIYAIPVAHADPINAVWNDDNADSGDNFIARASANGDEPASYVFGGRWVDDARKTRLENWSKMSAYTMKGETLGRSVTTRQANDACKAVLTFTASGEDRESLPTTARQAMYDGLSVQRIEVAEAELRAAPRSETRLSQ